MEEAWRDRGQTKHCEPEEGEDPPSPGRGWRFQLILQIVKSIPNSVLAFSKKVLYAYKLSLSLRTLEVMVYILPRITEGLSSQP